MTALHESLGRRPWLHKLVAALRIYPASGLFLRRFPLQRRLEPSGLVYRVTSLDQISIEYGIFAVEEYAPALEGRRVETFIDLGCNAGWFALWLISRAGTTRFRGLLVDAHPGMAAEAAWHMKRNGLSFPVVHGAAGLPEADSSTTFHLHPSTSASSVLAYQPGKQHPVKGRITEVKVPAVSVASEWTKRFGDATVDLLKVDIEGMELDFAKHESAFLKQRVRALIVEWHKWSVSLPQLDKQLESAGFMRLGVPMESETTGVALYENSGQLM